MKLEPRTARVETRITRVPLAILTGLGALAVFVWTMWVVVVVIFFDGDFPARPARVADDDRLRPPADLPAAPWRPADARRPDDPWAPR